MVWPALISAGASIIGGLLGQKSAKDAQKSNEDINAQNIALQKEFAQNSIQWKTEDAKKAGVHPLYALGAPTYSYNPSSVGAVADNSLGAGLANAGQDISRAMLASSDQDTRNVAFESRVNALQLTRMGLENDLLAAQIAKERSQIGPAMPSLTGPTVFGQNITPNPGFSDAETITNRYGEPAEWLYSPIVLGADAYENMPPWRQILGRIGEPVYRGLQYLREPPHVRELRARQRSN